jgi:hypothetical protein
MLDKVKHATIEDLSQEKGVNPPYASRILRLMLAAPEIVSPTSGRHSYNTVRHLFGDDLEVDEPRTAEAGGDCDVGRVAPGRH